MTTTRPFVSATAHALVAAGLLSFATGSTLAGDQPSADEIIKALMPKSMSRSLSLAPAAAAKNQEETQFLDSLRNRRTRSLTLAERDKIDSIAQSRPSVDLEINFEYNSAKLARSSLPQARALGEALSAPALAGDTFVVGGHTDAKGGKEFNQDLSERRADTIKQFLVENYKVPAANLVTVGYGKTRLKMADDPLAAENRRVQVINMMPN